MTNFALHILGKIENYNVIYFRLANSLTHKVLGAEVLYYTLYAALANILVMAALSFFTPTLEPFLRKQVGTSLAGCLAVFGIHLKRFPCIVYLHLISFTVQFESTSNWSSFFSLVLGFICYFHLLLVFCLIDWYADSQIAFNTVLYSIISY